MVVSGGELTSGQEVANAISGCMFASQESAFMQIKARGLSLRKESEHPLPNQFHSKLYLSPAGDLATNCFSLLHFSPRTMNNNNSKQSKRAYIYMVQTSTVF